MKFAHPVSHQKLKELEEEFEAEKDRLFRSGQELVEALRTDLSVMSWLRNHPLEAAAICAIAGFALAQGSLTRKTPQGQPQKL